MRDKKMGEFVGVKLHFSFRYCIMSRVSPISSKVSHD